jgi:hypothetical protein
MDSLNRRDFLSAAALLACAPAGLLKAAGNTSSGQIIHHVFFWLKNPGSEADKMKLIEGLQTLKDIKEVKQLIIGTPASTLKRDVVDNSFDVSELMYFDDVASQDAYQKHVVHELFIKNYSYLWEKVVVYDMLVQV